MNKYEAALEALKRTGSVASAADELGVSPKTIRNRVQALKHDINEYTMPNVRGRNSRKFLTLPGDARFYFSTPTAGQVDLDFVIRGLSRIPWNAGCSEPILSLAWVSLRFSEWALAKTNDVRFGRLALFWYSPAAFLGCVPREVEMHLTGNWPVINKATREAVYDAAGLLFDYTISSHEIASLADEWEMNIDDLERDTPSTPVADERNFHACARSLQVIKDFVDSDLDSCQNEIL